jgi:N-acetyl-anhydromuramyl-L-alanine amidase AmpD
MWYPEATQNPKLMFTDLEPLSAPPPWAVGHWTGGERGSEAIFRVLQERRLSVHFTGALDGSLCQHASLDRKCAHAGSTGNRGIGFEFANRGLPAKDGTSPRPFTVVTIHGVKVRAVHFTDPQLAAWVKACEWLAERYGWPRQVPNVLRQFTPKEAARFTGALEHLHLSRRKVDSGGYLVGALVKAGWKPVDP